MTRNIFKGMKASFNKYKAQIMLKDRLERRQITARKKISSGDSPTPTPSPSYDLWERLLRKTPSAQNVRLTLCKDTFSF